MISMTKEMDELFNDFSLADVLPIGSYLPLSKANQTVRDIAYKLKGYVEETLEEHKKNFNKGMVTVKL